MEKKKLKDTKQGELVRLKEDGPVWVRNHYSREISKYSLTKFDDTNHECFRKGNVEVFVGFEF